MNIKIPKYFSEINESEFSKLRVIIEEISIQKNKILNDLTQIIQNAAIEYEGKILDEGELLLVRDCFEFNFNLELFRRMGLISHDAKVYVLDRNTRETNFNFKINNIVIDKTS